MFVISFQIVSYNFFMRRNQKYVCITQTNSRVLSPEGWENTGTKVVPSTWQVVSLR